MDDAQQDPAIFSVMSGLAAKLSQEQSFPHGNYQGDAYPGFENGCYYIAALRTGQSNCADMLLVLDTDEAELVSRDTDEAECALADALFEARRRCGLEPTPDG